MRLKDCKTTLRACKNLGLKIPSTMRSVAKVESASAQGGMPGEEIWAVLEATAVSVALDMNSQDVAKLARACDDKPEKLSQRNSKVMANSVMSSRYMVIDRCDSRCRVARMLRGEGRIELKLMRSDHFTSMW